jgi:hypothetical protein
VPAKSWSDKQTQKAFFDQLAIKLNIQTVDDWNQVTSTAVFKEGGYFINRYYNGSLQKGNDVLWKVLTSASITSCIS